MQVILKTLSWTFLHSLWQGLIAALLAAIIITATKKASAKLRYNLLGVVLVLFLAATLITFQVILNEQQNSLAASLTANTITNDNNILYTSASYASSAAGTSMTEQLSTWFNNNADILMMAWAIFFLLNCLKLTTGLATINRLRHYKTSPVAAEWKTTMEALRAKLGISQPVQLLQSALVKVPVVLGILKPVILVPAGLLANIPPDQAEAILLHELAHVKRKDYLVNLLQRFADAIFFFNPAFTWISSLLRQEREACCDDIAVANTGEKRNYIEALVSFQEYSLNKTSPAMAFRTKRHYLLNRVKRIITSENKKLNLFEKMALLAGVILFSAFTIVQSKNIQEKTVQVTEPVSSLEKPVMTTELTPLAEVRELKPVSTAAKKELKKEIKIQSPAAVLRPDTIPAKKEPPRTIQPGGPVKFNGISTKTSENDGNKKQTIEAKDIDGNIYFLKRETGKPDEFSMNGRTIPANEQEKFAPVINHLIAKGDARLAEHKILTQDHKELKQGEDIRKKVLKQAEENRNKGLKQAEENRKKELDNIQQIKDKMAVKKKEIGDAKKKIQENPAMSESEKQELNSKIKKQRTDLEAQRSELERKRAEANKFQEKIQSLKHEKDQEGKQEKIEDKHEKKQEIKHDDKKGGSIGQSNRSTPSRIEKPRVQLFERKLKTDPIQTTTFKYEPTLIAKVDSKFLAKNDMKLVNKINVDRTFKLEQKWEPVPKSGWKLNDPRSAAVSSTDPGSCSGSGFAPGSGSGKGSGKGAGTGVKKPEAPTPPKPKAAQVAKPTH